MKKRLFKSTALGLVAAFLLTAFSVFPASGTTARRCDPKVTGSFIQSWLCAYWSDSRWDSELQSMVNAGVNYLVFGGSASQYKQSEGGKWNTYYPSALSELTGDNLNHCYGDVVGTVLRKCQQYGIKVFLGMGDYDDWWVNGGIGSSFTDYCQTSAKIAQELYNMYHSTYPDSFYGWYFVPELTNNYLNITPWVGNLSSGMNTIIAKLNTLNTNMPLMMSPYDSEYYTSSNLSDTQAFWESFFNSVNFRAGDIFCPQDAVGAGWVPRSDLENVTQMYRNAVDDVNKGIILWGNCENFIQARESTLLGPPATENTSNIAETLDLLVSQMNTESKYCDNLITFSYNHYYSPVYVNPVYNNEYLYYLNHNYTLETQKPTAPTDVNTALQSDGSLKITWSSFNDNVGIAYYRVLKDGSFAGRNDITGTSAPSTTFTDTSFDTSGQAEYEILAVDGAGNVSDPVKLYVKGQYPNTYVDLNPDYTYKNVTNLDSIPAGTKPGTNDPNGYFAYASDNGQSYNLEVKSGIGYKGSNGLQYSIPSGATDDKWVSVKIMPTSFSTASAKGANELSFWVDTTNMSDYQFSHQLYFNEMDNSANETTTWGLKSSGTFYIEDGRGGFIKMNIDGGYLTYPAGYRGFVRVPFASLEPKFNTTDSNSQFGMDNVNYFWLAFNSWKARAGCSVAFDHFGFDGNFTDGSAAPQQYYFENSTLVSFRNVPYGTKPGINDTAGYFSNVTDNGSSYLLEVAPNVGYNGTNCLKYSIPSDATQNKWVSVKILPKAFYSTDAKAAKELYFYIDTTGMSSYSFSHQLYFSETDNAANETTVWGIKSSSSFYLENSAGEFVKYTADGSYLTYPVGYKGFVKVPLESFEPKFGTADSNSQFGFDSINYFQLAFNSWSSRAGSSVIFDSFGFNGDFGNGNPMPSVY